MHKNNSVECIPKGWLIISRCWGKTDFTFFFIYVFFILWIFKMSKKYIYDMKDNLLANGRIQEIILPSKELTIQLAEKKNA